MIGGCTDLLENTDWWEISGCISGRILIGGRLLNGGRILIGGRIWVCISAHLSPHNAVAAEEVVCIHVHGSTFAFGTATLAT